MRENSWECDETARMKLLIACGSLQIKSQLNSNHSSKVSVLIIEENVQVFHQVIKVLAQENDAINELHQRILCIL
jgi:hypothetical protein